MINDATSENLFDRVFRNKIDYGRKKIILNYDEVTDENIGEILQKAYQWHTRNARDCDYLINYFLGRQDILDRMPPKTSEINNQVVVNYAFPITREIVGYTFGNPIEYIQKDVGKKTDVETLTDLLDQVSMFNVDTITAIFCSICGIGYEITLPNEKISKSVTPRYPITSTSLDPRDTFCVFSNKVGNPMILSCMIIHNEGENDTFVAYTDNYVYEFDNLFNRTSKERNVIGLNPITMFDNSIFRTGDWEQAISVMNASNIIASDSLNDVEGTIRSLLVILGAEFDEDDPNARLAKVKANQMLELVNPQGSKVDAKFISPQLDSSNIENIRQYLEDARNVITGIPDRQTASGGDTGTAVLNRNGWTDIEIVAKLKELFFKKAKSEQLNVAIKVMQLLGLVSKDLDAKDIKLEIGRHTTDNLQTKTQAFSTLVATGEMATIDALEMSGLTNRVNEVVERGEQMRKERQEEAIEYAKQQQEAFEETQNNGENTNPQNSASSKPTTSRGQNNNEKKKSKDSTSKSKE